jgi:hypothetical protein
MYSKTHPFYYKHLWVGKHIQSYDQQHNQDIEYFNPSQNVLSCPFIISACNLPLAPVRFLFLLMPFPVCHVNGIICYVANNSTFFYSTECIWVSSIFFYMLEIVAENFTKKMKYCNCRCKELREHQVAF